MNSNTYQYSPAVDPHIYRVEGCKTQKDWIALAVAAMDQAGLDVETQNKIEALIKESAPDNWGN